MCDWDNLRMEEKPYSQNRVCPDVLVYVINWFRYKIVLISRLVSIVLLSYICWYLYHQFRNQNNLRHIELVRLIQRVKKDVSVLPRGHVVSGWDTDVQWSDPYNR